MKYQCKRCKIYKPQKEFNIYSYKINVNCIDCIFQVKQQREKRLLKLLLK